MAILKERDKKAVKDKFEKELENDVKLIVFTQEFECEYCAVTRELMEELASLTNRIKLTVYDFEKDKDKAEKWRVDKIPALLIFGEKEYGIRYFGVPSGYEFAALLDDIVDVSRRRSRLSKATVDRLKDVNEPVHIQVFVTPTCPYCPKAVRTAHQMALENTNITADMIESLEFPHLANKYEVMAVPKIVINDKISFEGALPEQHFLEHVLLALKENLASG
ncbi:MAG TPA: glutaredoxin [Candidatus Caldiarchaeum subterraneum]|uniref:Glutaredoxin n=1 Tax=Caldiarchaeum subterraneum TaxID=311458 RepID=A0A832ZUC2_CALS0|nr:glutaredoxin [Candidatus Caldarchaeum subterraneum]